MSAPAPTLTIDELLARQASRYDRLTATEAAAAQAVGALLLDIRPAEQLQQLGTIPGALHIERTKLEWRIDPSSGSQHLEIAGREHELILICCGGYSSVLAVTALHELGYTATTDVIGGFSAWVEAGLPVERG